MGTNATGGPADAESAVAFERGIDWVVGGLLAVVGVLTAIGGYLLTTVVDRPTVAEAIRTGEFRSDVLTEAEAIDVFVALGQWGGIGLVAVGALFVIVGVAVVVVHGRARERGDGTPRWILGVVGAMVGTLLGFVPLSPALGGAAAGYLDPDESASGLGSGALAGLLATLPLLVWAGFASVGLLTVLDGELVGLAAIVGAVFVLFSVAYLVGLSALGGYVGGRLR